MQSSTSAVQAGLGTPRNEESHIVRSDAALRNNLNQLRDSMQPGAAAQLDHAKRLTTMVAKCALAGVTLIETTDDHGRPVYVVSRWALTRQLATLEEVQQWLAKLTGGAA